MKSNQRRPLAVISKYGINYLKYQNPYILIWWSACFPGFGQYLLNQYFRATLLTLTEVTINTLAHINEAIMYTFLGNFEMAKSILQPRWALGYIIIYIYAFWDTYRTTLVQNKMCHLAELENEPLNCMIISPSEIQYLEQKSPLTSALYSFLFPGLGQLYNHRFGLAFYAMLWWWIYASLSRAYEALMMIILGNFDDATRVIHPHWLLFMPSVLGGSIYQAFICSKEQNYLFRLEQRQFFEERYKNSNVSIFT